MAAATVSSLLKTPSTEAQLDLVCDECVYYDSCLTPAVDEGAGIFIDNSTSAVQEDEEEEEEVDDELEQPKKLVSSTESQIEFNTEEPESTTSTSTKADTNSDSAPIIDNDCEINGKMTVLLDFPKDAATEQTSEELKQFEDSEAQRAFDVFTFNNDNVDVEMARLTNLALKMGYARIIDYENLRIIEHVIESDDDDEAESAEAQQTTSEELQQACKDLVAFIDESYQLIDKSGVKVVGEQPTAHSIVDSNNNRSGTSGQASAKAARKTSTNQAHCSSTEPEPEQEQEPELELEPTAHSSALVKAYQSNLTPLAPPFQPAALRAQPQKPIASSSCNSNSNSNSNNNSSSNSNSNMSMQPHSTAYNRSQASSAAYAGYEHAAVYYQQHALNLPQQQHQQHQQQQQLSPKQQQQAHCSQHSGMPHIHLQSSNGPQLLPVQLITLTPTPTAAGATVATTAPTAAAAAAAASSAAWPLVEAPIYMDINGEYRSFCPAHGPPALAAAAAAAAYTLVIGIGVSED
ncbi:uncharacterized protein Dmoj_GI17263 [Drosophila mojavensis]|uniref:Uncharacterized protein n=1 Tax=Drosophila mojavensis TaxID=7230 RepID=B4KKT5_DROMO|nr:uncharacterized protein Dmoj_GI17263 [Drosophila mojavensis]